MHNIVTTHIHMSEERTTAFNSNDGWENRDKNPLHSKFVKGEEKKKREITC